MFAVIEGLGLSRVPGLSKLVTLFENVWDNQPRVEVIGLSQASAAAGATVTLRFRASRLTKYVRVHVQSTAVGKGGATYDAANFVSSTQVDCRENRQGDVTIARDGTETYWVWLIPELEYQVGSYTKYNGADGEDFMAFRYLGV